MKAVPKIYFFGDVHGQFQHVLDIVQHDRPDAIVLLGDLEPSQPLEEVLSPVLDKTIVRFIHGNHDTDSWDSYRNVFHCAISHLNLHGRVEEICGVRIAGLGGVFRSRIWMPPAQPIYDSYNGFCNALNEKRPLRDRKPTGTVTSSQEREHYSSVFPDAVAELMRQQADVLVTHEAPSCHQHGFSTIDTLAKGMRVRVAYHGHHHRFYAYRDDWPSLGFHAYGVGLHGVMPLTSEDLCPDPVVV